MKDFTTYTYAEKQKVAELLGFQNIEICLEYFKNKLLSDGLFLELKEKAARIERTLAREEK